MDFNLEELTDEEVILIVEALQERYTTIKEGSLTQWAKDIGLSHLLPQN